jgi:hypothetical protein
MRLHPLLVSFSFLPPLDKANKLKKEIRTSPFILALL